MSSLTEIICLANSRKHGARCIAGIVPSSGAWVRPVSDQDDGRVERTTRLIGGREPAIGDVLEIPLAHTGPDFGFECENRSILPGSWRSARVASPQELQAFVSSDRFVLHNDENYVTAESLASLPFEKRRTLQLVEVSDLSVFSAGPSANGGRKWKVAFTAASGGRLTCMLTDPVLVEKLESGYVPCRHALLTVSLSMPYRPPNWEGVGMPCWKLIASVIELDSPPAARMPDAAPARAPERPRIDDAQIAEALTNIFGYHSFRPGQGETVRAILDGRDVFAVMPTGGGKSLCYQLSACLLPGTCVVVSPLISLMKDQVDSARECGITAAYLNSSLTDAERVDVLRQFTTGRLDLIYVSPERFAMDQFLGCLKRATLCLVAVDEAHCISEWGHDFRPEYLALADILKQFPSVPIAAFTATATRRVQSDIIRRLGLSNPFVPPASFDRPNLFYEVIPKTDADGQILSFVQSRRGQSGIVYRMSRKSVERTCEFLRVNGIRSLPYHAGLDDGTRARNQEAFSRDEVDVVVATIAFGMGIDKSNVRYVVHGDLPKNIESYYQETGRAGRDGDPAHCLLLFSTGDIPRLGSFIDKVENDGERRRLRAALDQMASYARLTSCRRHKLLAYFGQEYPVRCGGCDNCRRDAPEASVDGQHAETVASGLRDGIETVITSDARIVLTAIVQCGARFGAIQVVDIIAGAKTKRIKQFGHDRLKVYGAGSARPKAHWRMIVDDLIAVGIVTRAEGEYPVLALGSGAAEVLGGEREVKVLRPIAAEKPMPAPSAHAGAGDGSLFDALRSLRRTLAASRGVPPYIVFSDRTLNEMVQRMPGTEEEMLQVNGVGEVKLAQFGQAFLAAIRDYAREHGVPESTPPPALPVRVYKEVPKREGLSETAQASWLLLQQGRGIAQVAEERGLTVTTIIGHIEQMILAGLDVGIDRYVLPARRDQIAGLFRELGTEALGPVVQASEGAFGYDEARLTRAWMHSRRAREP